MHRTTFENYVSLKVKAMQVYLKIRKRAERRKIRFFSSHAFTIFVIIWSVRNLSQEKI